MSEEAMTEWQPIETAPKDGTSILVYVAGESLYPTAANYCSREYLLEEYGDAEYMDEGWYWGYGYPTDFSAHVIEPTHWMPMPAPPKEEPCK